MTKKVQNEEKSPLSFRNTKTMTAICLGLGINGGAADVSRLFRNCAHD